MARKHGVEDEITYPQVPVTRVVRHGPHEMFGVHTSFSTRSPSSEGEPFSGEERYHPAYGISVYTPLSYDPSYILSGGRASGNPLERSGASRRSSLSIRGFESVDHHARYARYDALHPAVDAGHGIVILHLENV